MSIISVEKAFPCVGRAQLGMDLRDWFAGQALSGSLADPNVTLDGPESKETLARFCYLVADAMMVERDRRSDAE